MTSIQPEGEALRRAIRFVSDHLRETPEADPLALAHEAITQFDLNPMQSDYLIGFYRRVRDSRHE